MILAGAVQGWGDAVKIGKSWGEGTQDALWNHSSAPGRAIIDAIPFRTDYHHPCHALPSAYDGGDTDLPAVIQPLIRPSSVHDQTALLQDHGGSDQFKLGSESFIMN